MNKTERLLFVYDTFMKHEKDHHLLEKSRRITDTALLYDYGIYENTDYVQLHKSAGNEVYGEVYSVNDEVFQKIQEIYAERNMVFSNSRVLDYNDDYDRFLDVTFFYDPKPNPEVYMSSKTMRFKWYSKKMEDYTWLALYGPLMNMQFNHQLLEKLSCRSTDKLVPLDIKFIPYIRRGVITHPFYCASYSKVWKSATAYLDTSKKGRTDCIFALVRKSNVEFFQKLMGNQYTQKVKVMSDCYGNDVITFTSPAKLPEESPTDEYMNLWALGLSSLRNIHIEMAYQMLRYKEDFLKFNDEKQTFLDNESERIKSYFSKLTTDARLKNLRQNLDDYIVGNEETKKQVLGIILKNEMRGTIRHSEGERPIVVAIEGPSGSGKTAIAEVIAKLTDRPFISMDASAITTDSYSSSVNLGDAFAYSEYPVNKLENAVVFLDEFDKVPLDPRYGVENQKAFLNFFDGGKINVSFKQDRLCKPVKLSSSNMMIFVAGTFRVGTKPESEIRKAGFTASNSSVVELDDFRNRMKQIGFMDEIIGRISEKVTMNKLSADQLVTYLFKKGSILSDFRTQIEDMFDVRVELSESGKEGIAKIVTSSRFGMRELNYQLQPLFSKIVHDLSYELVDCNYLEICMENHKLTYNVMKYKEREMM